MSKDINTIIEEIQTEGIQNGFSFWKPKIGEHTKMAISNLKNPAIFSPVFPDDSLKQQLKTSLSLMSCATRKNEVQGTRRTGLAIGRVQSGKTTSFSLLSAIAADNDYKIVIHLLGTANSLRDSNFKDVSKILAINSNGTEWYPIEVNSQLNVESASLADMIEDSRDDDLFSKEPKVLYFYLLKQYQQIERLSNILEEIFQETTPKLTLIIDDEVDSYSVNTAGEMEKTTTFEQLETLYYTCPLLTYIGYTATSQAVWCANSDDFLSPHFHDLLQAGNGYKGNEEFFGKHENFISDDEEPYTQPHNPKVINIKRYNPTTGRDEIDEELRTESLYQAVCDFLISVVAINEEGRHKRPFTMMCIPERTLDPQQDADDDITEFLGLLKDALDNQDFTLDATTTLDRVFKLKEKDEQLPSWDICINNISRILNEKKYRIYQMNKGSPEPNWDESPVWFLIGAVQLNRGQVVKGIITTWLPQEPATIIGDTTQQKARWFGYKENTIAHSSIYLQENSRDKFRNYGHLESYMRNVMSDLMVDGESLKNISPDFLTLGMQPTAANKRGRYSPQLLRNNWNNIRYSPFGVDKNGNLIHNQAFRDCITDFLDDLSLSTVSSGNLFNANPNSAGQAFEYEEGIDLSYVNDNFFKKILPLIDEDDKKVKKVIKIIQSELKVKNVDIVLFHQGQKGRGLDIDCIEGDMYFLPASYTSGAATNQNQSQGYCGDKRVILNQTDPWNFSHEENTSITIQFHHFINITRHHTLGKEVLLNDAYTFQIHMNGEKIRLS